MIELVVAAALFMLVIIGASQVAERSLRLLQREKEGLEASYLIQEGMEGVRGLRDASWTNNIAPLLSGADYYLAASPSWTLSQNPPSPIFGKYYRVIEMQPVNRDGSDRISETGVNDPGTKKVTVTVSWRDRNATSTAVSSMYLSNIFQN